MEPLYPQSTAVHGSTGHQINIRMKGETSLSRSTVRTPEKKLISAALQFANLEKISTAIGVLGLFWGAMVLYGGFVSFLSSNDFRFVAINLLSESARMLSRFHELQLRLESSWTTSDGNAPNNKSSTNSSADWVYPSKTSSKVVYWLQVIAGLASSTISIVRLVQLSNESSSDVKNLRAALFIFYSLALGEGSLSLLEKAYWHWTVTHGQLIKEVSKECGFEEDMDCIKRFFLVSYVHCFQGSIFDDFNQDLVSFATKLLASDSSYKQHVGARILHKFSTNEQFSDDTLRKIASSMSVVERLVHMLNWNNPEEADLRVAAAEIVAKLAEKKEYSLQVGGFPSATVYISSLLDDIPTSEGEKEINLGLTILMELSEDHDNCEKIVRTRGLLAKILGALKHPMLRTNSAKILINLCEFLGKDCFAKVYGGVSAAAATVLRELMSKEKEVQEEILKLATQLFTSMTNEEARIAFNNFNQTGIEEAKLAMKILKFYPYQSAEAPKTKRFAIELSNFIMNKNRATVPTFSALGMEEELRTLGATASEIESTSIHSAVNEALKFLGEG